MLELKKLILEFLNKSACGRSKPVTSTELSDKFFSPERHIRYAILDLIDDGYAIASTSTRPAGYYIPETRLEAEECLRQLRSHTHSIFMRAKKLEIALQKKFNDGQLSLGMEIK